MVRVAKWREAVSHREDWMIARMSPAVRALAECKDAGDAKRVADLAHAAEVYARRQKLGNEAIDYARAVVVDAMTMMGEMLRTEPKNPGTRTAGGGKGAGGSIKAPPATPKLADLGISKKESAAAQTLATIKKKAPALHDKIKDGKTTVAKAKVEVRRQEKREELKQKAKAAPASPNWQIIHGDCRAQLGISERPRLIFADPPYNIGIDYGEGEEADELPYDDFIQFCSEWIAVCHARLTPDGSLWVLIGDEFAAEIAVLLRQHGFHRRAWIKWYETFGVNCANNFNRCSRHLFYCTREPDNFVFNETAVLRPSARQVIYNDGRASTSGKLWDDVWVIPRLPGTAKERIPDFPTQLPLELITPIIEVATEPGDLVLDPFSGSGTTGVSSIRLGRRFVGIEKSKEFVERSRERLAAEGCTK